ncbi:MAG: hypothetical protein NUV82_04470 [Candidatus Komeilibacteria bacterium]|nr:hypothetical protein [Candidatus Komeilibacteria bacterium]
MYLYIHDNFLSAKRYESALYRIENRLVDLGIKGRVVRLNVLKNMSEVVNDGIRQGVKTVVVVGDDSSFSKIINIIADKDVVLGIIPIDKRSKIGQLLGVPPGHAACETIAQRIIKTIDLGLVGNYYFIDSAIIRNENTLLKLKAFNIGTREPKSNQVSFNNLGVLSGVNTKQLSVNPTDGFLDLVVEDSESLLSRNKATSHFRFKELTVECAQPGAIITVDQVAKLKTPTTVQIAKGKLKVIVGTKRLFD